MFLLNSALSNMDGVALPAGESELEMDQDAFEALYEETARGMWAFLLRKTGDEQLAEDLLQETYYRFLRTRRTYEGSAHMRHYLFRIASNVAGDALRRRARGSATAVDESSLASNRDDGADCRRRTDLARAMTHLNPRQREALWLAYAEGSSHAEIAEILGLRTASIKPLLFRARKKLAGILRRRGAR